MKINITIERNTIERNNKRKPKKPKKQKKKMKTLNLILLCLGLFVVFFIITMIVIFCIKGSVPDTLIQMTLGAGGVEAFFTAAITIVKIWRGNKDNESTEVISDEDHME